MRPKTDRHRLWSVGGCKGGTGKTFVAGSLGLLLGGSGFDTNLLDLDLGGANLHTFLGIPLPAVSIEDFLTGKVPTLRSVLSDTRFPGIKFASGSARPSGYAKMFHGQKRRLIRYLPSLEGRCVLDLGAGAHPDNLDFFRASQLGVIVLTPEPASVENLYQFIGSMLMRYAVDKGPTQKIMDALEAQSLRTKEAVSTLLDSLGTESNSQGEKVSQSISNIHLGLIVNRTRNKSEELLGRSVASLIRRYFSCDCRFLGSVPEDPMLVGWSSQFREPYVLARPEAPATMAVKKILPALLEFSTSLRYSSPHRPSGETHYSSLGVPPTATEAQIREAYLLALDTYRPDSLASYSFLSAEEQASELAAAREAFDILADPVKRKAYDERSCRQSSTSAGKPLFLENVQNHHTVWSRIKLLFGGRTAEESHLPGEPGHSDDSNEAESLRTLGLYLKYIRESKSIQLREISGRTRITLSQLQALEDGDLQRLPGGEYPRLILAAYAKELGLDIHEWIASNGPRNR